MRMSASLSDRFLREGRRQLTLRLPRLISKVALPARQLGAAGGVHPCRSITDFSSAKGSFVGPVTWCCWLVRRVSAHRRAQRLGWEVGCACHPELRPIGGWRAGG
jgi:hypothetical protein